MESSWPRKDWVPFSYWVIFLILSYTWFCSDLCEKKSFSVDFLGGCGSGLASSPGSMVVPAVGRTSLGSEGSLATWGSEAGLPASRRSQGRMLPVGGRGSLAAVEARAAGGGWRPTGVSVQLMVLDRSRVGGNFKLGLALSGVRLRPGCSH